MKKSVIVKGPALSQSGYGVQTRFALKALRQYEEYFDIYLINTPWGATGWIWEENEEREWIDNLLRKTQKLIVNHNGQMMLNKEFDLSVQSVLPNEVEPLAKKNICYTAGIETNKIPQGWYEKSLFVNKIITTSEHSKYGFETAKFQAYNQQNQLVDIVLKEHTELQTVNYAVNPNVFKTSETQPKLWDSLDKLSSDFNFLVVAQWCARKNLEQIISGFIEEFYDDENVGLVLKINNVKNSIVDKDITNNRLIQLLAKFGNEYKCKVHLLHGDLKDDEMKTLYQHPKIRSLINLSHGEGFGLPVFEAISYDLPVITIPWGGVTDFIYYPKKVKGKVKKQCGIVKVAYELKPVQNEAVNQWIVKDSQWAFPVEWNYKKQLRRFYKDPKPFEVEAMRLGKYVRETFTEENQHKQFAEAVYGSELQRIEDVPLDEIPKISILTSVYNGDEFIVPFMEDMVNQTIFKEKCELILVDANSPGNELEKIQDYLEKYDNIKVIKLKEDRGVYNAWNRALQKATGDFVTNANLDDRHSPEFMEKMAKYLVRNSDVDLVYGDSLKTDSANETFTNNTSDSQYNFEEFSKEAMLRANLPHCCPMWRKSLHDKFGYFDESLRSAADWKYWLTCAFGGSKFMKVPEVLSLYYFNPTGISTNPENNSWKREEEKSVFKEFLAKLKEEQNA